MKRAEKTLICLLCGFVLSPAAHAVTATAATGNPYQSIVERNLFNLKPAPRPEDGPKTPPPLPPKIELTGIMTILGKKQVLMKVHKDAKPPEPAKDESYILSEGEREGDVEVVAIDPVNGTVKLNNHGIPQDLSLDKDAAKVTSAPPPAPGTPPPLPMFQPPLPGGAIPSQDPNLRSIPLPNRPLRQAGGLGANAQPSSFSPSLPGALGGPGGLGSPGGLTYDPQKAAAQVSQMPFEEQMILQEAQRLKYQQEGSPFAIPPLPPKIQHALGIPTPEATPAQQ